MRIFTYKVWQKMFFRGKEGHHLSIKCKKLKNKNGRCHFFATKIEMHTFIFCHKNNDAKKTSYTRQETVQCSKLPTIRFG